MRKDHEAQPAIPPQNACVQADLVALKFSRKAAVTQKSKYGTSDMRAISEAAAVNWAKGNIAEMMVFGCEVNADWVRKKNWMVVPQESGGRFFPEDIDRIVSALSQAGFTRSSAVTTEDLGDLPSCYEIAITKDDFIELNRVLGTFRFVLTSESRNWAISCNEWYNLFAGDSRLVSALLGKSIEEAREEFMTMALELARSNPGEPLLQVARHYAAL